MNALKPDISVLMSIYNEALDDIRTSIHSVLSQTVKDTEIIIVNDNPGRKDIHWLLDEMVSLHSNITVIHNTENIGLAASMNKALQHANGQYIARMDADDYSLPTRFEKELKILCNDEADVVSTNYALIGPEGEFLNDGKPAGRHIEEGQDITELLVFNGLVHHPTVMMKKEALIRVGGYRIFPCSQDQDLWIRMLESGARFVYLDEVLLHYRIRKDSISQKKGLQQYVTIDYILQLLKERSENGGKDSYSLDRYSQYISMKCNDSKEAERFSKGVNKLTTALEVKQNNKIRNLFLRIDAFITSKTLRGTYLFKLRNRKRILAYLNQCSKQTGGHSIV